MIVFVNNNPLEMEKPETIPVVLRLFNISEPKGIAVAVNNIVIPKSDWEIISINENDKVTVIRATQGG